MHREALCVLTVLLLLSGTLVSVSLVSTQAVSGNVESKHIIPTYEFSISDIRQKQKMPDISWARTYGGPEYEWASDIQGTSDGGYIVAGYSSTFGGLWILKLDVNGKIEWQKVYSINGDEWATGVQQTSDGGYIVAGVITSPDTDVWDIWVLKLDHRGNVMWQKAYGTPNYDVPSEIHQTANGGYVVAGNTKFFTNDTDGWILKLDSYGNIEWQKTYRKRGFDLISSIQPNEDGGYVVCGTTNSSGAGGSDLWVLKLDAEGNVLWQKTYGGSGNDEGRTIRTAPDGGYIVAGKTTSFGAGGADLWVLKLDENGTVMWQKTYGDSDYEGFSSMDVTSDGGCVIAGGYSERWDAWVLKLDASGNVEWQRTYGRHIEGDDANAIQQTSDGGYIVGGTVWTSRSIHNDLWVLKLDSEGKVNFDPDSGMVMEDTSCIVTETDVSGVDFFVTPLTLSAYVRDTNATVIDTDCEVRTQSVRYLPGRPQNLTAALTDGAVVLKWKPPSSNGSSPLTGYRVYRKANDSSISLMAELNASTLTYVDADVNPGRVYRYYVTAMNELGESVERASFTIKYCEKPTPPTNLTAQAAVGEIKLSWQKPEDNGGTNVTSYRIYRSEDGVNFTLVAEVNASTLSYVDENVSAGKTYYYYVTAVNEVGESRESEIVKVRIPAGQGWETTETVAVLILAAIVAGCAGALIYRRKKKP